MALPEEAGGEPLPATKARSETGRNAGPGPVALVGSGEYLPVMAEMEAALLDGRPPRYVQLPTAAAQEGPASVGRWVALGEEQAARLGVTAEPLMVLDRASAEDPATAASLRGAGLIYLSGGNPAFLIETLRGTAVWRAVMAEWQGGAALAGCSAGAMALAAWSPEIGRSGSTSGPAGPRPGLAVAPEIEVVPHFDRMKLWRPGLSAAAAATLPPGTTLVGIDEETAIICDGTDRRRWRVWGRQKAWVFSSGAWEPHQAGQEFTVGAGAVHP